MCVRFSAARLFVPRRAAGMSRRLERRRLELQSELEDISKALKREQRTARDAARAEARRWSLTGGVLHTVLIIYALCDSAVPPASKYLRTLALERGWPPKDDDELEVLVLGAFAEASVPLLVGLTDEHDPTDVFAMRVAQVYCLEWRLVLWATHINATTGERPETYMVLCRWDAQRKDLPEHIRPWSRSREWVRRWLARWDGSYGVALIGDEPPLADKLAKVGVFDVSPERLHPPKTMSWQTPSVHGCSSPFGKRRPTKRATFWN